MFCDCFYCYKSMNCNLVNFCVFFVFLLAALVFCTLHILASAIKHQPKFVTSDQPSGIFFTYFGLGSTTPPHHNDYSTELQLLYFPQRDNFDYKKSLIISHFPNSKRRKLVSTSDTEDIQRWRQNDHKNFTAWAKPSQLRLL